MTIADHNLASLLSALNDRERRSVENLLKGARTDEGAVVLRWIRRKLKRRVRSKRR